MPQQKAITALRYAGNILLVIGYFVLLHVSVRTGVILNLIGGFLTVPFALRHRLWDLLATCAFFTVVEIVKLSSI